MLLAFAFLAFLASCRKDSEQPQKKCDFITDKYHTDNTYFVLGESPEPGPRQSTTIQESRSVYDSHKIGDWYCYSIEQ